MRMTESCGNSVFKFLRDFSTAFHSSCAVLRSHAQGTGPQFLHVLVDSCYFLFDKGHADGCEVSHCGCERNFPND